MTGSGRSARARDSSRAGSGAAAGVAWVGGETAGAGAEPGCRIRLGDYRRAAGYQPDQRRRGTDRGDLVLIPAKASPCDVWAASDVVAAVQARQESSGGMPQAAFIITMTRARTRLGRQIDQALAEYGLPTLQARTTERVSYPQAAIEGRSVLESRDQTARNEILAIRGEIERLLNDIAQ